MPEMFMIAIMFMVAIGILVLITRWIFKIDKQLENQETTIQLLGHLLIRNGMTNEEVERILRKNPVK